MRGASTLGLRALENFQTAIQRATDSCETAEHAASDHLRGVTKLIEPGTVPVLSGTEQRCRNIVPMYAQ